MEKKVSRNEKPRTGLGRIGIIALLGIMLLLMIYKIYCGAQYNELNNELASLKNEYSQLIEDEKQLNLQLSARADLRNIEEIASGKLGMSKIEQNQIEYISLGSEDKTVIVEGGNEGIFGGVFKNFSILFEYFG